MPGFPPSPRVRCRKVFVTYLLTTYAAAGRRAAVCGVCFCLLFRACPRRPGRRRGARPRVKRNRFARAGAGGSGLPVWRGAIAGAAERGPSVPGALALAPALRLPARDGTSYQRTTSRDWSSGRANGYAANAALSSGTARPRPPRPRGAAAPTRTPRRKIIHITAKPTPIGQHKTCMCGAT